MLALGGCRICRGPDPTGRPLGDNHPQTGNTLNQIVYLGSPSLQADVENRIRNSNPAKRLVAEGKAQIVKVETEVTGGKLAVAVTFRALDAPNSSLLKRAWSN